MRTMIRVHRTASWSYDANMSEYDNAMTIDDVVKYEQNLDKDGIIESLQGEEFGPPDNLEFMVKVTVVED